MKFVRAARVAIGGVASAAVVLIPAPGVAGATTVPFTDQNAHGYIGFCNASGQPITSGSLLDAPFVWTAASSTPAPSGYAQGKATLYVFQPRQNVPAAEWSGEQVSGSSSYTNPSHPMAQATSKDPPLISVDGAFPPKWDGLYQLRIYFTGANLLPYTSSYPASVIRVVGNKWSVVQGGTVACDSGKATSNEVVALDKPSLKTPQSGTVTQGTAQGSVAGNSSTLGSAASADAKSGSLSGSSNSARTGASGSLAAAEPVGAGARKGGGISGGTIAAIALIAAAALTGGGAGLTLWRRRSTVHSGGGPVPTGL